MANVVDLVTQVLGVELGCALAVVVDPFGGEVQRDLWEVVGDDLPGGDLDDGRDGDAAVVVRETGEVGLLEPFDTEYWVDLAGVEIEGPAALIVGGSGQAEGDDVLQAEESANDQGAVGPRARTGGDQPVATGFDGVAVVTVTGDAGLDVVGISVEVTAAADVRAWWRVFGRCLGVLVGRHDPSVEWCAGRLFERIPRASREVSVSQRRTPHLDAEVRPCGGGRGARVRRRRCPTTG